MIGAELSRRKRYNDSFALIIVDLDRFRQVNISTADKPCNRIERVRLAGQSMCQAKKQARNERGVI